MILKTRLGHNIRFSAAGEWGTDHVIPSPGTGFGAWSGVSITEDVAYGLPAVSNVIRSPAEIIASLPFFVYTNGPVRARADQSWQWDLLHEHPSEECDTFEFFYDLALSLEATQNAFVRKAKTSSRVVELYVLDPHRVTVRRDKETGEKLFDVTTQPGAVNKGLTTGEILHIRGFTPTPGGVAGVSLLRMHRDPLGAMVAMQRFEGDYFRNNARAPFWFTGAANKQQAQDMLDLHNQQHQGQGNQYKAGALWGTADVKALPLSMEDATFADAKRLSIEDACRIWRWPKQLLELSAEQGPVDENAWTARFLKFYLLPRLRRIERAFAADPDLFAGQPVFGEFLTAALERADFVTRVRGYKDARQGGWITGNEIRELENYPPIDGGDTLLETPTGSAPNQAPAAYTNGHGEAVSLADLLTPR